MLMAGVAGCAGLCKCPCDTAAAPAVGGPASARGGLVPPYDNELIVRGQSPGSAYDPGPGGYPRGPQPVSGAAAPGYSPLYGANQPPPYPPPQAPPPYGAPVQQNQPYGPPVYPNTGAPAPYAGAPPANQPYIPP